MDEVMNIVYCPIFLGVGHQRGRFLKPLKNKEVRTSHIRDKAQKNTKMGQKWDSWS
jgi:hypothetical protein